MAYRDVRVDVYDIQGRLIKTVLDRVLPAGNYTVEWNGTLDGGVRAAAGAYVFRVRVGDAQASRTMMLVR